MQWVCLKTETVGEILLIDISIPVEFQVCGNLEVLIMVITTIVVAVKIMMMVKIKAT